jgi:hypothetical protein
MRAKWLYAVRRVASVSNRKSLGPVFFVLSQSQVYHIAGHGMFNENDFTLDTGETLALGGIVLYEHLFKYW